MPKAVAAPFLAMCAVLAGPLVAQGDRPGDPVPLLAVPEIPAVLDHAARNTSESASDILQIDQAPVPESDQHSLSPEVSLSTYWMVNTWTSPQSFDDSRPVYCPEITRFDEGAGYHRSDAEDLRNSLVPGVPICLVVHGSFMDYPSVRPFACSTWRWLKSGADGRPFHMIYFSWPSDRPLSALAGIDVAILGRRASRNGFYLLSLLQSLPPESPVCLVGHSHGTRVISSALHLMGGGTVEGLQHHCRGTQGRRIRVVFTAAAIDHDWLNPGERFDRALCSVECLINLRNNHDPALLAYVLRRVGSSRALGFSGFTKSDIQDLGRLKNRVRNWDVSPLIGAGHFWPNYVQRPQIAAGLRNYLYFADLTPGVHSVTAGITATSTPVFTVKRMPLSAIAAD